MKKYLLMLMLSAAAIPAFAQQNEWASDTNAGITEFNLLNTRNQALSFSCTTGDTGETNPASREPAFSYIEDWNAMRRSSISNENLQLVIDNRNTVRPVAGQWGNLLNALSRAKRVEVKSGNRTLEVFTPSAKSIREVARYLPNDCKR